ncbi:MAG: ATP-binding protein, partial [Desulfobacterales bacterium]|nr:ATP-binding protein [Desulfobacterales bacterium]
EMAAGLAHEIKNPLASIAGSIQLLREEVRYNAGQDKLMLIILREADRLNALLSNFLLFARPPAGKVQQIDLAGALEETVELFEKDLACYGKILVTKLISRGVWVAMDPTHLRQVLWNLLNNAAEAIKNSGHIDIHMEPLKNRAVAIRITDDGCGIAPGNIQSIFNPFFTTKADGTGLGLSIVHSILKSYGNRIEVQSVVNRGTTFTLRLKATDSPT